MQLVQSDLFRPFRIKFRLECVDLLAKLGRFHTRRIDLTLQLRVIKVLVQRLLLHLLTDLFHLHFGLSFFLGLFLVRVVLLVQLVDLPVYFVKRGTLFLDFLVDLFQFRLLIFADLVLLLSSYLFSFVFGHYLFYFRLGAILVTEDLEFLYFYVFFRLLLQTQLFVVLIL